MEPLHSKDPTEIGPYRVVAHLGTGGMGRVYLAETGGKTAAIKILSPAGIRSANMRARFEREIGALRKIQSPFVAPILDSDVEPHELWLAVEYISGPSLAQRVEYSQSLSEQEWLELLLGSLVALTSVHDLGIIHRDIKPANILLSDMGPQLIDFGIAQSLDETSLTTTQGFAGSPAWASPDVFGEDELTEKTDIFSLGSTLVFALTGQSPWGSSSTRAGQVMTRLREQQPQLTDVPGPYRLLIAKMLDKSPKSRPSARECLELAVDLAQGPALDRLCTWVDLRRSDGRTVPKDVAELIEAKSRQRAQQAVDQATAEARSLLVSARRDAERIAKESLAEAQATAQTQAARIVEQAQRDADATRANASQRASDELHKARAEADAIVRKAKKDSKRNKSAHGKDADAEITKPHPPRGGRATLRVIAGAVGGALFASGLWWLVTAGGVSWLLATAQMVNADANPQGVEGEADVNSGASESIVPTCAGLLCDVAFRVSTSGPDSVVITGWARGGFVVPEEPLAVEFLNADGRPQPVGSCGTAVEIPYLTTVDFHPVWSVECAGIDSIESWPSKYVQGQEGETLVQTLRAGPDHSNRYTNEWGQSNFVLDETVDLVRGSTHEWYELSETIFPDAQYGQATPQKLFSRAHQVHFGNGIAIYWVGGDLVGQSAQDLFEQAYRFLPDENTLIRQDCVAGSLDATGLPGWSRVDSWEPLVPGNLWEKGRWDRLLNAEWSSDCDPGQVSRTYTLNLSDLQLSDTCLRVRFTNTAAEISTEQNSSQEEWCVSEVPIQPDGEGRAVGENAISPDTVDLTITPHQWLNANIVNLSIPQPDDNEVVGASLLLSDRAGERIDLVAGKAFSESNEPVDACPYGFEVSRQGSARQDRIFFQQRCGPPQLSGGTAIVAIEFQDGSTQRVSTTF